MYSQLSVYAEGNGQTGNNNSLMSIVRNVGIHSPCQEVQINDAEISGEKAIIASDVIIGTVWKSVSFTNKSKTLIEKSGVFSIKGNTVIAKGATFVVRQSSIIR